MSGSKIKVCANCNKRYIEGDRFCRYCGAPYGRPKFIEERFEVIYGPRPITRQHICKECGYKWETYCMVDNERCCPKCGSDAPVIAPDGWS